MERLVASPCSLPKLPLAELLPAYAGLGFRKLEVFTSWAESRFDPARPASEYLALGRAFGLRYTSLHLPPVRQDDPASVATAIAMARFAAELGVGVVLYKADSRASYIACAPSFLAGIGGLGVVPVLQNHFGTPLTSLADLQEAMDGIADPRMHVLLEVGHLAVAGVHWGRVCDLYGDRIALVHVKDIAAGRPVPFGEGEVDFAGLLARLGQMGYWGDFVVEIEVPVDDQSRLRLMADACVYLAEHGLKES